METYRTGPETVCVDAVFQDTWLLALDIRNGHPVAIDNALFSRCCRQVESARSQMSALPQATVDELLFAQCALIDETVKTLPDTDVSVWYSQSLQSHFFNRIDAGDVIFERIHRLLHQPAPPPELVCMYHRLLLLGFRGKYRGGNEAECLALMRRLDAMLPEPQTATAPGEVIVFSGKRGHSHWRSPWVMLTFLTVVTALLWAGLRMFLHAQLAG